MGAESAFDGPIIVLNDYNWKVAADIGLVKDEGLLF